MTKKIAALILALVLALLVLPIYAEGDVITVSDKSSFLRLAEKCTLDSWSVGKTVNLTADIDFSGEEFKPIATFSGVFNGNGHTIKGIKISKSGSFLGVFRYVENGANVNNLNVSGNINPGGSASFIGGVAGSNSGSIISCSFNGTVKGKSVVGGIAGLNTESGKIAYSSYLGNVLGNNAVGGISGKNEGYISLCTNYGNINTVEVDSSSSFGSDFDLETRVESAKIKSKTDKEAEDGIFKSYYDIGGIAGLSKGIIGSSVNEGKVGYQHIGYNVGGIAGRQSGLIEGCKNNGEIYGRKDVGGIVGQAEPYIMLNVSESTLQKVKRELDTFNAMTNTLIDNTDSAVDSISSCLDNIADYAGAAKDWASDLLDITRDFIDDNLDEINTYSAIITTAIDSSRAVLDLISDSASSISDAADDIKEALDAIRLYTPDIDFEIDLLSEAFKDLSDGADELKSATNYAKRALSRLSRGIMLENEKDVQSALNDMSGALKTLLSGSRTIESALEDIQDILSDADFEGADDLVKALKSCIDEIKPMSGAIGDIGTGIGVLLSNTKIDFEQFKKASEYFDDSLDCLSAGFKAISSASAALGDSVSGLHEKLSDYADDMASQLNEANDSLKKASKAMSYAFDDLGEAFSDLSDIAEDISDAGPMEFKKLGSDFEEAGDNLFDSVTSISDELEKMKDRLDEDRKILKDDVQRLSDQFDLIINLIIDSITESEEKYLDFKAEDYFLDVSEEEINTSTKGKVTKCENSGMVNGDRNAGGIAGAISVENTNDLEDDFEKPANLNFVYKTKAIVSECVNRGELSGKKDCIGGIAGNVSLGVIYMCENYAGVKSDSGSYVGGIAGYSESVIKKSYSKCRVEGESNVGGIAGYTESMAESASNCEIIGDEYIGSIAGDTNSTDIIRNCFYLDRGLGAIDGISYKNHAEGATYEKLSGLNGVPDDFISFYVTFKSDGETIAKESVKYGESYDRIKEPLVPEKKGCFGVWEDIGAGSVTSDIVIEAVYRDYITLIESEERNNTGKLAIGLAEGEFTEDAVLRVSKINTEIPDGVNKDSADIYEIKLSGSGIDDGSEVKLRLINENKDKVSVWYKKDGEWIKTDSQNRGRYVKFSVDSTSVTVCVEHKGSSLITALISLTILALGTSLVIIIIKKRGIRREKKV